jgi:hypothetical protein
MSKYTYPFLKSAGETLSPGEIVKVDRSSGIVEVAQIPLGVGGVSITPSEGNSKTLSITTDAQGNIYQVGSIQGRIRLDGQAMTLDHPTLYVSGPAFASAESGGDFFSIFPQLAMAEDIASYAIAWTCDPQKLYITGPFLGDRQRSPVGNRQRSNELNFRGQFILELDLQGQVLNQYFIENAKPFSDLGAVAGQGGNVYFYGNTAQRIRIVTLENGSDRPSNTRNVVTVLTSEVIVGNDNAGYITLYDGQRWKWIRILQTIPPMMSPEDKNTLPGEQMASPPTAQMTPASQTTPPIFQTTPPTEQTIPPTEQMVPPIASAQVVSPPVNAFLSFLDEFMASTFPLQSSGGTRSSRGDFVYLSVIDVGGGSLYAAGAIRGEPPLSADCNFTTSTTTSASAVVMRLDAETGDIVWIRVRDSLHSALYRSLSADSNGVYAAGIECRGSLSSIFLERISVSGEIYATRAFNISSEVWVLQIKVCEDQVFLLAPSYRETDILYLNALSLELNWQWYLPLRGVARSVYGQAVTCFCQQVYLGLGATTTLTIGDYILTRSPSISPETAGVVIVLRHLLPKNLGVVVAWDSSVDSSESCSSQVGVRFLS